jgi:competence protein ComEC
MIRLLVPLAAGIVIQVKFHVGIDQWLVLCLSIILVITCFSIRGSNFHYRWVFGILTNAFLLFSGIQLVIWKQTLCTFDNGFGKGLVMAVVSEPPEEKEKSFKIITHVIGIKEGRDWRVTDAKALIYITKDSSSAKLQLGSLLLLENRFAAIKNKGNPNEFDIQRYYGIKGIYQSGWFPSKSWKKIGEGFGNPILLYSNLLRNKLLGLFKKLGCKGDEYSVLSALTLGYTLDLDDDIKRAYSESGTMHVLSVSGLHVAIVFMVINYLLFFFNKNKIQRYIKALICILLIWGYAILSGSSPAVLRSALMISFVAFGNVLERPANIFNTLAASAFILLIYNPFLLLDVSFQLSYLAVAGIVLFQPIVYKLLDVDHWLLEKVWALTSVSIAAQLGTVPISLYYFHQFPNYFIFANMLIIPLTSFIIYLTVILFAFSGIPFLASFIAKILFWSVHFTNASVRFIESLPLAVSRGIYLDTRMTMLLYIFIIVFTSWVVYKQYKLLIINLLCIIIILSITLMVQIRKIEQQKIIVYNIQGISAIDFIKGRYNLFLYDTGSRGSQKSLEYCIKPNWFSEKITKTTKVNMNTLSTIPREAKMLQYFNLLGGNPVLQFENKRMVCIRNMDWKHPERARKLKVNYLVLSGNLKISIKSLLTHFQPEEIIIDSSNKPYLTNRLTAECAALHIKCHAVGTKGAFVAVVNE